MYFEIEGVTYMVKFIRVDSTTYAELFKVGKKGNLIRLHQVGEARLFYRDKFNEETGRKHALSRVLDKMNKHVVKLSVDVRKALWEEYFKTHKK